MKQNNKLTRSRKKEKKRNCGSLGHKRARKKNRPANRDSIFESTRYAEFKLCVRVCLSVSVSTSTHKRTHTHRERKKCYDVKLNDKLCKDWRRKQNSPSQKENFFSSRMLNDL